MSPAPGPNVPEQLGPGTEGTSKSLTALPKEGTVHGHLTHFIPFFFPGGGTQLCSGVALGSVPMAGEVGPFRAAPETELRHPPTPASEPAQPLMLS